MHRILKLKNHFFPNKLSESQQTKQESSKKESTLTIVDNRTGKTYTLKITDGQLPGDELAKIRDPSNIPLALYDPGYHNTSIGNSRISFVEGGNLFYRGIPIEQLVERSTFLEVSFLLIYGELPSPKDFDEWKEKINTHNFVHEDMFAMLNSFRYNSHPMSMLISLISAHSTLYADANPALAGEKIYDNPKIKNKQIYRILGKMPTLTANVYLKLTGREYSNPNDKFGFIENFLYMIDSQGSDKYKPNPRLAKALDMLFILNAENEMNNTSAFLRHLASSGVDVYSCMAGANAAFYGFRVGGATRTISDMLAEIKTQENIPAFLEDVKQKKKFLWGFEHQTEQKDPRTTWIKRIAEEVFNVVGKENKIAIALALEQAVEKDEFFQKRNLKANSDFYTGIIYGAMGFSEDFMPILLAIPRAAGWLAHWSEYMNEKDKKIVRPKQNYVGYPRRDYISILDRSDKNFFLESGSTYDERRREVEISRI